MSEIPTCAKCGNIYAIFEADGQPVCECCHLTQLLGAHDCEGHMEAGKFPPFQRLVVDPTRVPTECKCDIYSGSERNAQGFKVCERCGGHLEPAPREEGKP